MNNLGKNVVFWLAIGLMLAVMLNAFQTGKMGGISQSDEIAYSDFMSESKSGRIGDVLIQGQDMLSSVLKEQAFVFKPKRATRIKSVFFQFFYRGFQCYFLLECGFSLCVKCKEKAAVVRWALVVAVRSFSLKNMAV